MTKRNLGLSLRDVLQDTELRLLLHTYEGRLGNHMFQFASTYALAKSTSRTLVLTSDNILLIIFPEVQRHALVVNDITERNMIYGDHPNLSVINETRGAYVYDEKFKVELEKETPHVRLRGYLQSWKYFENFKNDVKSFFRISPTFQYKAKKRLRAISTQYLRNHPWLNPNASLTFIGVHIRRGDFLDSPERKRSMAPANYLTKAMSVYRQNFTHAVFLMLSDDPPWVEEQFSGQPDVFHISEESTQRFNAAPADEASIMLSDFATLVACNHTIRTQGTFGWWAGYLGGGKSIYYSNFYANTEDYIRPNEIRLS